MGVSLPLSLEIKKAIRVVTSDKITKLGNQQAAVKTVPKLETQATHLTRWELLTLTVSPICRR